MMNSQNFPKIGLESPLSQGVDFEIFIEAEPDRVYHALTTGEGLDAWFTDGAEVDCRAGGSIRFVWRNYGIHNYAGENGGPVLNAEPAKRFVFQWKSDDERYWTTVSLDFAALNKGTLLTLHESGYEDSPAGIKQLMARSTGWAGVLTTMKCWLEHGVR